MALEGRRILEHVAAMSAQFGTTVVLEEEGGSEEGEEGSVVGWVVGGGAVKVGERADPTLGGVVDAITQRDGKQLAKAALPGKVADDRTTVKAT